MSIDTKALRKEAEDAQRTLGNERKFRPGEIIALCDELDAARSAHRSGEAVAAEPFCYVYTEPDFMGDMNNAPVQGYTDFSDGPKPGYEPLYKGAPPPSVPTGYKLVPEEPTEEMMRAAMGWREFDCPEGYESLRSFYGTYRAMLAAAPPAPASQERGEVLEETMPYDAVLKQAGTMWSKPLQINGNIYGDRKGRFADGTNVTTSVVQSIEGDIVRTRNSIYRVEWIDDKARAIAIRTLKDPTHD